MNRVPLLHEVFIALGSNLGDRAANLRKAREEMGTQVPIHAASAIYETPPWGVTDQPIFLNQVVRASTALSPLELLVFLKSIEKQMGRVETVRFGPRVIDLDILLYSDQQVNLPQLVIPHPRMCQRAFVLVPLAELAPQLVIPGSGKTVTQHLAEVAQDGITKYPPESGSTP